MSSVTHTEPAPTLDEIWRLFKETDRKFQETVQQMKETDRKFQETDRKIQETDRIVKETTKAIGQLGNRLGEFVEGMVAPAAVRLFQERGIAVSGLSRDAQREDTRLGLAAQIDLLVVNGDACIAIEVKSHLSQDDVNEHLQRLEKFKPLFSEYRQHKVYGAVAAMVIPPAVAKYAYRKGLFVLGQNGDTVEILNDAKFQPAAW
jgi:hypothetical protein